ncbi:MAG: DUF2341 domain-containing protein [Candidatus Saccharimonas sp.]
MKRKLSSYDRFWQWRHRKRISIPIGIAATLLVAVFILGQFQNVLAISSWTQSDWTGGVGSSTTNQYSAGTNVNTTVSNQVTLSGKANWYNGNWQYRKQITIDHTKVASDQVNFAVLVKLASDSDLVAHAQASGNDLVFTDANGTTQLNYEVESYSSANGGLVAWVKVPNLSSTIDTTLYMYYGNSAASSQQNSAGVWDSNYEGVWHLGLNGGTVSTEDSTSHARNGANNGATGNIGQIGNGVKLLGNGTTYIDAGPNPILGNQPFTMSTWVKTPQASNYGGALSIGGSSTGGSAYIGTVSGSVQSGTGNSLGGGFYGLNIGSGTAQANQWAYLTMTFSGGSNGIITFYVNGVARVSTTSTPALTSDSIKIGRIASDTAYDFSGLVDEARLSNSARSVSWITTNYNNQSSPATFETMTAQESNFQSPASLTSNIFDTELAEDWAGLTYDSTAPAGTTVSVKVRAGNLPDLSDAPSFSACTAVASGADITSGCAPDKSRYVQYQISLTSDGRASPVVRGVNISYSASDSTPPIVNATNVKLKTNSSGSAVASNGWTISYPYASWDAGEDDSGGSGLAGYCLYLGQDSTGNPRTTKGYLGTSPLDTGGACQFAVSADSVDLSVANMIGTPLVSSTSPYYLNILAVDKAGNVYGSSPASFQFRFDNTAPDNPAFISAPSQFVSSKTINLTWPVTGAQSADDADSGVAGLQYKIGQNGTWYGDNHNGAQDNTDLLPNNGSYTTQTNPDFTDLKEGNNIVYFRTWDNAGNVSAAHVTTVIKLNTTAPTPPQNLTASPSLNTMNSFAFSWLAPTNFQGSAANITYCYSVNIVPTVSNCIFTNPGQTSLSAGAYATAPGQNTMYVVAKDEAGNINYATAASIDFTANTPAPGIPLNLDAADISIKDKGVWKIALSWEEPADVGAGIANYQVVRSTDGSHFTKIATTAGKSFVDTGLNQQLYYYQVKACDSANNCGVTTSSVQLYPTGKFTAPANLTYGPTFTTTTRSASISWATDRDSDSQVEYGLSSAHYFATAAANSIQTSAHTVLLDNLEAGTTYYYRALWADPDGNIGQSTEGKFSTNPAPNVSDVVVSNVNLHTAVISFKTQGSSALKLYYGPNGSFGNVVQINTSEDISSYSLPLDSLSDGTVYTYRLNPIDRSGYEYKNSTSLSFVTPPAPRITNVQFEPVPGSLTGTEKVIWTTNVPTTSQISYGQEGQAATAGTEAIDTTPTLNHEMTLSDLSYNMAYWLSATSRDDLGNVAVSDRQVFHTGLDTRPPVVSQVTIQPSIKGSGVNAQGQVVVSWKTDKPGTSQVAYGQGTGKDYSAKTAEDTSKVLNHVVVISNLAPSHVYHLQTLSRDDAGNVGKSPDRTTIIGQATDSIINIIFDALSGIFGGL